MSRHRGSTPDIFKLCKFCGSKNTKELLSNDDENIYRFIYFGWCKDCQDTYDYSLRVDTVHDRKGRI